MATLAPDDKSNKYNTATGQLNPNYSISVDSLSSPTELQTTTPKVDPIVASGQGIINNAISSIPQAQTDVDTAHTNDKTSLDRITALMNSELGKSADSAQAYTDAGVDTEKANYDKYNQDLNDINASVAGLANEAKAIPLKVQQNNANTGATDAGVAPQTAGQLRENAIKALTASSLADIATANINNSAIRYNAAKDKADKAVDLKYQPIETELSNLKEQLTLNKEYITDPAEKKLADAQQRVLDERTTTIAQQKSDEKDVNAIKIEYAKNGNNPSDITATTPSEAIKQAGNGLSSPTTQIIQTDNGDGTKSTLLVDTKTGKVIKSISGGGGSNTSTPTTVVRTVQTGTGTTPVNGYSVKAGDDAWHIAQANGTDVDTLRALNPQIADITQIQPGQILNLPNQQESWLAGKTPDQVAAYNGLPDNDKATIKQIVNGDALITDIVKSRGITSTKAINDLINKATAIDPNFSVNTNKQRYTYKQQFNNPNGKEQVQINAINTALGHLAEFKTDSQALGNSIVLPYNQLTNYLTKNAGKPEIASFNTVVTALAGELASVYKGGTAPTDQEITEWRNNLLSSFSNSQFNGVTNTTANLISNKLLSLGSSYKNVMGEYPDAPLVNSDVLDTLTNTGVDTSAINSALKKQGYSVPTSSTSSSTSILDNLWNQLSQ